MTNENPLQELTQSEFESVKESLEEGDTIRIVYQNTKIDDQGRNPMEKTIAITNTSDSWILGKDTENPSRNRGYGIVNRVYGGEQRTMFVGKNYVRGMRDNHYIGPTLEIQKQQKQ